MMAGVVAAQQAVAEGSGEPWAGSLLYADFVNGDYYLAESAVALAAIIDQPGLVGASGLAIPDNLEGGAVFVIGDFLAALLAAAIAGCTIVIEYEQADLTARTYMLGLAEAEGVYDHWLYLYRDNSGNGRAATADHNAGSDYGAAIDAGYPVTAGTHKVAVTRTDSRIALSVDGRAVEADETDVAMGANLTLAAFGGQGADAWSWDPCNIRSLQVLPVQDDWLLPTLSAI